ncbi:Rid family detoxifying hydrolase [Wenzhouxiangella sp. XN24]|uniref:Rid family detoxifying hydrolase n=1 Tax=Wenzhouxiangella sp. XN24 TaxID=2713569 RepID=UPI0013EA019E|nr:Rid family detoxifying hydrolase [Wenzhouxiangella sp. XN24]NGX17457.1 RidA family protein [Wenzhouxiangella sp. XN24]
MTRRTIATSNAPAAIGTYAQAVAAGGAIWLSGQIPLDPETMTLVEGDIEAEVRQVFRNLSAVAAAAGATLDDAVRLTVYLTDLGDFAVVNEVMAEVLRPPYPSRATVEVAGLPKGARVEVDAVLVPGT